MKVKAFLIIILLCCLQQSAVAASADYIYEVGMVADEEVGTSGAAVLLDPEKGLYITAFHTIQNGRKWNKDSVLKVDIYGRLFAADILAVSKNHDLVLFHGPVRKESKQLARLALGIAKKDKEVFAISLRPGVSGMTPVTRAGAVREIKNWTIAISSEGEEGMSGGGIFSDGKLVGLIAKKFDDKKGGILGANTNALEYFLQVSEGFLSDKKVYDADALAYASK